MTLKVAQPVRVPELGPHLGKLVSETRQEPIPELSAVRVKLVTRIFSLVGEARRIAETERTSAIATLSRDTWLDAWEDAAQSAADVINHRIVERLTTVASQVKYPARRLAAALPAEPDRRRIAARLGSCGARLVDALDAVNDAGAKLRDGSVTDRGILEEWQDSLKRAARRTEEAWLKLADSVEREEQSWAVVIDEVARWKPPLWPVAAVLLVAIGPAIWLGLALGGYIAMPSWLASLVNAVF